MNAYIRLDKPLVSEKRIAAVSAGQTIAQALDGLQIALPQAAVALVNGKTFDLSYLLEPGDSVSFLFQISGG